MKPERKLNRLAEILEGQGRSQKWLSKQLNVSHITVNKYCLNLAQPTVEGLYQIATVLGIDVGDLLIKNLKINPKKTPRTRKDARRKPDKGTDNSDPDAPQ